MRKHKRLGVMALMCGPLEDLDQYVAHCVEYPTANEFIEAVNREYDREGRPEQVTVEYCRWLPYRGSVKDYDYYLTKGVKGPAQGAFKAWFVDLNKDI